MNFLSKTFKKAEMKPVVIKEEVGIQPEEPKPLVVQFNKGCDVEYHYVNYPSCRLHLSGPFQKSVMLKREALKFNVELLDSHVGSKLIFGWPCPNNDGHIAQCRYQHKWDYEQVIKYYLDDKQFAMLNKYTDSKAITNCYIGERLVEDVPLYNMPSLVKLDFVGPFILIPVDSLFDSRLQSVDITIAIKSHTHLWPFHWNMHDYDLKVEFDKK